MYTSGLRSRIEGQVALRSRFLITSSAFSLAWVSAPLMVGPFGFHGAVEITPYRWWR